MGAKRAFTITDPSIAQGIWRYYPYERRGSSRGNLRNFEKGMKGRKKIWSQKIHMREDE